MKFECSSKERQADTGGDSVKDRAVYYAHRIHTADMEEPNGKGHKRTL